MSVNLYRKQFNITDQITNCFPFNKQNHLRLSERELNSALAYQLKK